MEAFFFLKFASQEKIEVEKIDGAVETLPKEVSRTVSDALGVSAHLDTS